MVQAYRFLQVRIHDLARCTTYGPEVDETNTTATATGGNDDDDDDIDLFGSDEEEDPEAVHL
jgi:hypothetical protein